MTIPVKKLRDGVEIPMIGFGTFQIPPGDDTVKAVEAAIAAGYTSIDTAAAYHNEESVGQAIKNAGKKREELFITTKLWNEEQGYDSTLKAFDASMEKLGLDYLDLYLIHWPGKEFYVDTWKAFIKLQKDGRIRSIGVSNFFDVHIKKLEAETGVLPSVNQVENHPYIYQAQAIDYCKQNDILIESWSPLMSGGTVLGDATIAGITKKYNKSNAQVVLKWHIQNGYRPIPKSVTPSRIKENLELFDFELAAEDMAAINELTKKNERIGPDPMVFFIPGQ